MQKIVILGGTGFIGKHLLNKLDGTYNVVLLSRTPDKYENLKSTHVDVIKYDISDPQFLASVLSDTYGVINLAGESVAGRWTASKKEKIYNSRIMASKMIAGAFKIVEKKPSFLIQGSGIGVYGCDPEDQDESFTEESALGNEGFLTKVGVENENAVRVLEDITRVVYLRTGIVLDATEGALPQMIMPYKFSMGGPIGNGKQWSSWIHIKDEVRAIKFLIENDSAKGAYNLTAPTPVSNNEMAESIGNTLNKPAKLRIPAFILKLMLGEMADELLLNGLKVIPKRLLDAGFRFQFETIESALKNLLNSKSK